MGRKRKLKKPRNPVAREVKKKQQRVIPNKKKDFKHDCQKKDYEE